MSDRINIPYDDDKTFNGYQTTKHKAIDIETRKALAVDDIRNNYPDGADIQLKDRTSDIYQTVKEYTFGKKQAIDTVNSGAIYDGYKRLWDNYDSQSKVVKPIDKYGHINNAPKSQLIVETSEPLVTHTKPRRVVVSSYNKKASAPKGAIDIHDINTVLKAHGKEELDITVTKDWSELPESVRGEHFDEIKIQCALREFLEETGVDVSQFKDRIVLETPYESWGVFVYPFKLLLTNDEYDELTRSITNGSSGTPQPEISDIYYQKYLKYKNKYLQLKLK
jgi:hypothetical protein